MLTAAALRSRLEPDLAAPRWWLGCSGGVDSLLLLHLLAEQAGRPPLSAVHVHHGLQPQADAWSALCREACAELGVDFLEQRVEVGGASGVEAAARSARYAVFARLLGPDEVLFLAHHGDDQLETLLLRLLRGAGVGGLAAMPRRRPLGAGVLARPLLTCWRADIERAAQARGLHWAEDPSNRDTRFERNFLRRKVLPLLARRWPDYRLRLRRSVTELGDAAEVLAECGDEDLARCGYRAADHSLELSAVAALSRARQRNLVRHWLRVSGLPLPAATAWSQWPQLLAAGVDAEPCWRWSGAQVRRFRGRLYALPELPPVPAQEGGDWIAPGGWSSPAMGCLHADPVTGSGLRADLNYRVVPRRGGERCRPLGREHSQTLKKLFQEYAVPPWWRDRVPLLYCGETLAAVGDFWICVGFQAEPGERGWRLQWTPPGVPHPAPSR